MEADVSPSQRDFSLYRRFYKSAAVTCQFSRRPAVSPVTTPPFLLASPWCNFAAAAPTAPFQSFCCFAHYGPTVSSPLLFPTYTNIFRRRSSRFLQSAGGGIRVWRRPEFLVWLSAGKKTLPRLCGGSWTWVDFLWKVLKTLCSRSILVAKCLHKHHLCRVGGKRQENWCIYYFSQFSALRDGDWDVWWLRFTYSQRDASRRLRSLWSSVFFVFLLFDILCVKYRDSSRSKVEINTCSSFWFLWLVYSIFKDPSMMGQFYLNTKKLCCISDSLMKSSKRV